MPLYRATDDDLPAIAALVNSAYRGETSRQGWTTEADYLDGQRTDAGTLAADLAANPAARLMLWRDADDGALLGAVWLEPAEAAEYLVRAIVRRPRDLTFPASATFGMGLLRRLPGRVYDRLMDRIGPEALTTEF